MCSLEEVLNGIECHLRQVEGGLVLSVIVMGEDLLILQLLVNLFPRPNERHTVDRCHHGLLHKLSLYVSLQFM